MKNILRLMLIIVAMTAVAGTDWVTCSAQEECMGIQEQMPPAQLGQAAFFSAHSITQENYSIWLKEHSAWRREYSEELESFTYIPQDYDPARR